jgi:tetratricopeptide (TPR) repeat protein
MSPSQANPTAPVRDRVFVSYSHLDQEWLNKFRQILGPDIRNDRIDYWDDRTIQPGDHWHERILDNIDHARVTVLLVSPNFLASRFIMEEELPRILRAADDGLTVLWVPLSGTFYGPEAMKDVEILNPLQAVCDPAQPLDRLPAEGQTGQLLDLCRRINKLLNPGHIPIKIPFPTLGNLFKGRENELAQLDEQLRSHGSFAIVQPQAVSGLGGIGKTRLAVEYAWRHQADFTALLFVSANTPEDLATNLARLSAGDALDLPEQLGKQDEQYAAVIRWLRQNKGWLLILDNVDTREGVAAVQKLVAQISGGQILITSRYTRWGEGILRLSLDVIPLADAVALLLEKTHSQRERRPEDEREAGVLAERLGCLPLALTHAAAYVGEYDLGFAAYLSEFDRALQYFDHEVIKYETDPEKAGILKTVATTFFMSFDRLGVMDKAILRAVSFLAPEPVPVAMFEESPDEVTVLVDLWCEEKGEQAAERTVRDALAELARFSLITRGDGVFSVHRMEQLVLRSAVPKDRVPRWIEAARAVLVHYAPDETAEDPKTWPIWDKLRPHAEVLVAAAQADDLVEPHLDLIGSLGSLYYGKGLYKENLAIDEAALKVSERVDGPESANFAHRMLCYGETLRAMGRYAGAEAAFRKSLAIRERLEGPKSMSVASDLNYLAIAIEHLGKVAEAEELLRRALTIYESEPDAEPAGFAKVLTNLGDLLTNRGDIEEAERMCRRSLPLCEAGFGSAHPSTLIARSNLASVLSRKGDYREAESIYRTALEVCEPVLGPEHPIILGVTHQLAAVLEKMGDHTAAEQLYRRAMDAMERVLGAEHPWTLIVVGKLAGVLKEKGDYATAESLYRRALEARERVLGLEHPDTLRSVNNLANLLYKKGDYAAAEPFYRRALEARERVLGFDHPDTLTSVNNLANLLYKKGDYAAAEPFYRRALEAQERVLGFEHPDTLITVTNLANSLRTKGDYAGAEPLCTRALEARERALGRDHPETISTANSLAMLLYDRGDYGGAETLFRRALESSERVAGPEHKDTLAITGNLASVIEKKGDYEAAEPWYRRVLEVKEKTGETEQPEFAKDLNNYALLLRKLNRFDEAADFLRRAISIDDRVLLAGDPIHAHRRNNLAIVCMLAGQLDEARHVNAEAWLLKAGQCDVTVGRILFTRTALCWSRNADASHYLGQLGTLLVQADLFCPGDIARRWDAADIVDALRSRLTPDKADFLVALVAALNEPNKVADLERFSIWNSTMPVPLEAPWPNEPDSGSRPMPE